MTDFSEKQHFLNTVYERFFQGYSVKVADTHGIVYTPQEIVDFMCASVDEVLQDGVRQDAGRPGRQHPRPVHRHRQLHRQPACAASPSSDLPRVYREQLFANEVMLLPYYIAALNIEHAYYELTGNYEPFEGLCFVDTLDLAEDEAARSSFMTREEHGACRAAEEDADHGDYRQSAVQRGPD